MEAPERHPGDRGAVLLRTGPDPKGFLFRYLLALTPLVLFGVSVIATAMMRGFLTGSFSSAMNSPLRGLLAGMEDLMEMTVLLTAPVGVYFTFVLIGLRVRSTEMWTGSALALGLSALGGFLLFTLSPDRSVSPSLDLLYWIAYLAGPASLVAVILVLGFTEQYRRSITYTIGREGLILGGGIWKRREHLLPWHQIGSLVLEQGPLEKRLGTGTIVPLVTGGPGSTGRKAGREPSRSPLECLSGIREPDLVMEFLQELISRPANGDS